MTFDELIAKKQADIEAQENLCLRMKEFAEQAQENLTLNRGALQQMRKELQQLGRMKNEEVSSASNPTPPA